MLPMTRPIEHLLLVTMEDPYDRRSWSGIPFSLRTALERQLPRVTTFRPSRPRRTLYASLRRLFLGRKKFPLWITRPTLRRASRELHAEIRRIQPDAVLSLSSTSVAFLRNPGVPVFLFSDAPYLAFAQAYAPWETSPRELPRFGRDEAASAIRLDGLCFGSQWACDQAERLYALPPEAARRLLHVTPLGANWTPTLTREQILTRAAQRTSDRIHLLFVGRDWERKGGPLAVEVAQALRDRGQTVALHIVGCRPALPPHTTGTDGFVIVHGLLMQTDATQCAKLAELFLSCHFLLVPTLAECFGIVFAESQAFALPPISRAVHALPSIIADGQTGMLFPPQAPASLYAERILACIAHPEAYAAMARQARDRFEQTLNWDATARTILSAIRSTAPQPTPSQSF